MRTDMFSGLRIFDASSGALRNPQARGAQEQFVAEQNLPFATRRLMASLTHFVLETTTLEKLLLCSCPLAFVCNQSIDEASGAGPEDGVFWVQDPGFSLVRALSANTSLLELDLSCCQADAAAGAQLGATVARHPTLRSLNVAHNLLPTPAPPPSPTAPSPRRSGYLRMPFTGAADGCCGSALTLRPADASPASRPRALRLQRAAGVASLAAVGGVCAGRRGRRRV